MVAIRKIMSPVQLPQRPLCSALGDSIFADAYSGTSIYTNWGMLAWARRYLKGRIELPISRIYAIAGSTIATVVSNQLASAVADTSDTVFVHCGTNSLGSDTNDNLTIGASGLKTIYDALIAAGKFVIAIPIRCHGTSAALSTANLKQMAYINRWIANYAATHSGIMVVDINPNYIDFSTGLGSSTYLRDDLHDSVTGAMLGGGRVIADVLLPLLPPIDTRFIHVGDVYDAAANPTGSLLTNSILTGTGGTLLNGGTGTVASNFRGYRAANSGTLAAAFSKGADATYSTLPTQVITLSGTGDGVSAILDQQVAVGSIVAAGDVLYAECEVELTITSGSFSACSLELAIENGAFANMLSAWDGYPTPANGYFPAGTYSYTLRTGTVTVPSSPGYFHPKFTVTPNAGTLDAVVKVKRFAVRKVI